MDQVVPESPGRIVTLQKQRREMQTPSFSIFLLFKIPLSRGEREQVTSKVHLLAFSPPAAAGAPIKLCLNFLPGL